MICSVGRCSTQGTFLPIINMIENSLHINGMYDSKAVRFQPLNVGFPPPIRPLSVRARHLRHRWREWCVSAKCGKSFSYVLVLAHSKYSIDIY